MTDARQSYDVMASGYDEYTSANDYEMWLGEILLSELEKHGLRKGRALDVGCGTGRAFPPLLARGWDLTGCDISPAMVAEARAKFGDAVPLVVADMRELPALGDFDLILALNDAVNYLADDGDLERALAAMAANLTLAGFLLFDSNTLGAFQEGYAPDAVAGGTYETTLSGEGMEPHAHRQRHFPPEQLTAAIDAGGLRLLAMLGQREEGGKVILSEKVDEQRDAKIVCIARKAG